MINISEIRDVLTEVLEPPAPAPGDAPLWVVEPRGFDEPTGFPVVVVGMPSWRPGPTGCLDLYEWPIACIVEQPGGSASFSAVIEDLDTLWTTILDRLTEACKSDRRLGKAAHVVRAEFGTYPVQGQSFPAQLIFVSIDG